MEQPEEPEGVSPSPPTSPDQEEPAERRTGGDGSITNAQHDQGQDSVDLLALSLSLAEVIISEDNPQHDEATEEVPTGETGGKSGKSKEGTSPSRVDPEHVISTLSVDSFSSVDSDIFQNILSSLGGDRSLQNHPGSGALDFEALDFQAMAQLTSVYGQPRKKLKLLEDKHDEDPPHPDQPPVPLEPSSSSTSPLAFNLPVPQFTIGTVGDAEATSKSPSSKKKRFTCHQCCTHFTTGYSLKNHLRSVHSNERPFPCTYPKCSKAFTRKFLLDKHTLTAHQRDNRPFICEICGDTFALKWNLDLHLQTHSDAKPYQCDQCSMTFASSRALSRHRDTIHKDDRPYKCDKCSSAFKRKDHLDNHVKRVHREPITQVETEPPLDNRVELSEIFKAVTKPVKGVAGSKRRTGNQAFGPEEPEVPQPGPSSRLFPPPPRKMARESAPEPEQAPAQDNIPVAEVQGPAAGPAPPLSGLPLLFAILRKAAEKQVEQFFQGTAGNTIAHQMTMIIRTPEDYHDFVRLMVDLGKGHYFNVHLEDDGNTAVHMALRHLDLLPATIDLLWLSCQFNFNSENDAGFTALHVASASRSVKVIERIVERGGDWGLKCKTGNGVLHVAAVCGKVETLRYFLRLGAEVDAKDEYGCTALHKGIRCLEEDKWLEVITLLMFHGGDINAVNELEGNGMFVAVASGKGRDDLKLIKELGGDWRGVNGFGQGVLHIAAQGGNLEGLRYFLELGADVNGTDMDGETPLWRATRVKEGDFVEVVKILVEGGGDLEAVDQNDRTVLLEAVWQGRSKEEVECVVKLGGDWSKTDKHGLSVVHLSAMKGRLDLIEYFVGLGADVNGLSDAGLGAFYLAATFGGGREMLEGIKELGGEWNISNFSGETVLHGAAMDGNLEAVKYLVELGADVEDRDFEEETPLHKVRYAERNFVEVATLLVQAGADVNAVDEHGSNLLLLTFMMIVEDLERSVEELEGGGDPTLVNSAGLSALLVAALGGNLEVVKMFLKYGADINHVYERGPNLVLQGILEGKGMEELKEIVELGGRWREERNGDGDTVLHAAVEKGDLEVVRYLVEEMGDSRLTRGIRRGRRLCIS